MEHRIGRIQPFSTHDYYPSSPATNARRRHPHPHPFPSPLPDSPHNSLYIPACSDQTLEDALSRLTLTPSYSQQRQQLLPPATLNGNISELAFLSHHPFSEREPLNVSCLEPNYSYRLPNSAVNGGQTTTQMGFGVGVGPVNPNVDPLGNRTAAVPVPNSWYGGDSVQQLQQQPSHEFDSNFDQNQLHACLLRKKQLLCQQLNSQSQPFLPSSTTSQFDALLNGFGPNPTRPNLQNSFPEHFNFLNLDDFRGKIVDLAKDQNGSRVLQLKLENPTHEEIEMVLTEVIDHLGDLMINQFGNNVIQKLVAVCNDDQRSRIIRSMIMNPYQCQLIYICRNPYGTKAVQKLLESLTLPQQVSSLIAALSPGAAALAKDTNGHHVIQYCLLNFPNDCNQHIVREIADHCYEVAIDKSGCCVLQSCVQSSQGESRRHLVAQVIANSIHLAADPYGNYVLQHMLGMRVPEITRDLLRNLEGNYVALACNKYASNVVEKCLIESGEEQSTRIIMELVRSTNAPMLLLDPYGNFVIQSALSVSRGFARNSLLHLVQQNIASMRSNLYGKKVLAWIEKRKTQQPQQQVHS